MTDFVLPQTMYLTPDMIDGVVGFCNEMLYPQLLAAESAEEVDNAIQTVQAEFNMALDASDLTFDQQDEAWKILEAYVAPWYQYVNGLVEVSTGTTSQRGLPPKPGFPSDVKAGRWYSTPMARAAFTGIGGFVAYLLADQIAQEYL